MIKLYKILLFIVILSHLNGFSQNSRDKFITDSIMPYAGKNNNSAMFHKLLKNIQQLELDYNTYEPDFRYYMLLEHAYNVGEILFFKEQLSILVERYGFQVPYMKETESYYKAIMTGELATWFREMYLEKHVIWLKNNFDKQIDLRKLNALSEMDQAINSYYHYVKDNLALDSIQKAKNRELSDTYLLKSAGILNSVANKNKAFPTGKSFAVVQNTFSIVETHNMQSQRNYDRFYILFFDYYKKAYLNNDMYYTIFNNLDFYSFEHHGYQKFGLLTKEEMMKWQIKNKLKINTIDIPIEDKKFSDQLKKEFKWY